MWQIAVLIVPIVSLRAIFTTMLLNTQKAERIANAHLMVIPNDAIVPATTPAYQKFLT